MLFCDSLLLEKKKSTFFPPPTPLTQGRCDINIRNNRNQTPLQLAVTQGHTDLVQLLVAEGADVNMEDEDGDTAMHVALLRPQLANVMLSPTVGTSSTEDSSEGCSSTSLYCRVRATGEVACR